MDEPAVSLIRFAVSRDLRLTLTLLAKLFALCNALLGLGIELLRLGRAASLLGKRTNPHRTLIEALPQPYLGAHFYFLAGLRSTAVALHLAALYSLFGEAASFVETRCPQPLVESQAGEVAVGILFSPLYWISLRQPDGEVNPR